MKGSLDHCADVHAQTKSVTAWTVHTQVYHCACTGKANWMLVLCIVYMYCIQHPWSYSHTILLFSKFFLLFSQTQQTKELFLLSSGHCLVFRPPIVVCLSVWTAADLNMDSGCKKQSFTQNSPNHPRFLYAVCRSSCQSAALLLAC